MTTGESDNGTARFPEDTLYQISSMDNALGMLFHSYVVLLISCLPFSRELPLL